MKILAALLLSLGFMSQVGYASTECGRMNTDRIYADTNPSKSKRKAPSKRPAPRSQTTVSSQTQR